MQPAFFNEKVYRENGFKSAMEKTIDDWSRILIDGQNKNNYLCSACFNSVNLV